MIYLIGILIITVILFCYSETIKKISEAEERAIRRHLLLEDWLFQSLYSINHNVKLPDEIIEIIPKKASVYNPLKDPMSEFTGDLDDWH